MDSRDQDVDVLEDVDKLGLWTLQINTGDSNSPLLEGDNVGFLDGSGSGKGDDFLVPEVLSLKDNCKFGTGGMIPSLGCWTQKER